MFSSSNFTSASSKNPISFNASLKTVEIDADEMNINSTQGGLSIDLYVVKQDRVGVSQRMEVSLNLSSVLSISTNTDVKEMARQLDKLDDFAKKNPTKALSILTGFVSVINSKADSISEQVLKREKKSARLPFKLTTCSNLNPNRYLTRPRQQPRLQPQGRRQ